MSFNPTQYLKQYGMAIASVAIALLLMLALDPVLQLTQAPFLLFFGAVAISAFYGGRGPGIVATLLSAVFANYFFQYPQYSWALDLVSVLRLALFILEGVLVSLLVGALRTAQAQARKNFDRLKASEAEIRDLNQALQRQVDELQTLAAAKLASEDRYRVLISSIDEGFGICEMLLDEDGKPIDFRILEVNPVFEPLTGLDQAVGKTARELVPDVEDVWFETYGRVALTREPIRFEQKSGPLKRWFDINAFPIGEPERHRFGILFTNITARKAAEQERERFLAVGSDLQVITGSDGFFQWVSPTFERVLGWTVKEMTSRPWTEFVHPDDINPSVLEAEYLFKGSDTLAFENRYRHKDGSYRWLLWKAQPDLEQQVLYGAAVDITERKRREANAAFLAEIAADFSRLSTAQDIIQSVGAKLGPYLNLATCHLVEIDEVADQSSISECWRVPEAPVISGSYRISQFLTDEIYRALHAGETVAVNDTQNDSRVNAQAYAPTGIRGFLTVPFFRFGEWRYLLSATTSQVRNWRESEIELIQELSNRLFPRLERARAEDALRESEERFRQLAENIDIVFWIREVPEGQLAYISPAYERLWGLNRQDLYESQQTWVNYIHPDDRELTDRAFQEKAAAGQFDEEYRIVLPNGSVRWVRDRCFPLQDETGAIYRFTGIAEDITDRKQTEAEREQLLQREQAARAAAERANRIKDEFLSILSHELRSPLNPILGWSRLLQAQKFNEAKTKEALATIERNARLQTQLIDDLLDMSRILRGKLSLNEAPVNLVSAIAAALEVVRTAAEAKSISLLSELTDAGQVRGDNARLQQIVWNLLSNAIKFTPMGGRVTIRLDRVDDCAQITVADTGRGISREFLPYIFESFRQEDTSITRQHGGLGLGLSIVKYLVDAHGGTITANSPGEGQGATFTVKLPLLKDELTLPATNPFFSVGIDLSGIKVLAVDDNEDARELLTTLLTQYGAQAKVVASGHEVLVLLNRFEPDVLVCDLGMPEMDGYTLLQQIRALPTSQGGGVPAIALTAYAREEDYQKALAHGFQRHIAKPLEPAILAIAIAELAIKSFSRPRLPIFGGN